jgi:cysteinyl-tRNA synthetase
VLRLYDTALEEVTPLEPRQGGEFSMYVCGPTVSGEPHLGHGRFTVVWDIFRRYLEWTGLSVRFVSNVTDIEDKILAKAAAERRPPEEVAAHYEKLWWETMDRLGVARPSDAPHATAYVDDMVRLIQDLVDRGHAYVGGDGVYFSAESVAGYGLLAHQSLDSLRAGARVEVGEEAGKRAPIDFVLWKLAKPGEPSWESPWGKGRPGWHTECVVMSLDLLGENFDLHTGGLDLAFPHHENERVQALAVHRPFTRHWAHHGMIVDEGGEKMSKSVGNTLSLLELLDTYDPRAFRFLVLQSHYRRPMTVGPATMEAAVRGVERLDIFAREFRAARGATPDPAALARFKERMDDDFDTPNAVGGAFELLRDARAAASADDAVRLAAAVFDIFEHALGLSLKEGSDEIPPDVIALVTERDQARSDRDFAKADSIRTALEADGWIVEDGPDGTAVRRA